MPKIRLNKAIKDFNISMSRLVEFLQGQGFAVDENPNAQLDEAAYGALKAEFMKDSEQRKASHEVVMAKVPEEKLVIEEKAPEVIKARAAVRPETRILGKIDLNPKKAEVPAETPAPVPEVPVQKEEPKVESPSVVEKQEFKILDKIDLSQIETGKPRSSKKEQPKPEPAKPAAEVKETPKAAEAPAPEVPVAQTPKPAETATPAIPAIQESENLGDNKIETVYQKLDGPKILKQTVDLSQFNKPKSQGANSAAAKKKRKRIEKPNPTGGTAQSGTAGSGGQGNRPGGQGNRPAGRSE